MYVFVGREVIERGAATTDIKVYLGVRMDRKDIYKPVFIRIVTGKLQIVD